jgi:hypothetical protein
LAEHQKQLEQQWQGGRSRIQPPAQFVVCSPSTQWYCVLRSLTLSLCFPGEALSIVVSGDCYRARLSTKRIRNQQQRWLATLEEGSFFRWSCCGLLPVVRPTPGRRSLEGRRLHHSRGDAAAAAAGAAGVPRGHRHHHRRHSPPSEAAVQKARLVNQRPKKPPKCRT